MKERPLYGLLSLIVLLLSIVIVACQKDEEVVPEDTVLPNIVLPQPPKRLSADTVTDSSAIVTWEKSTDHSQVANYVVYQDSIEVFRDTLTRYVAKSLEPETSYQFLVRSTDKEGNTSKFSEELLVRTKAQDTVVRDSVSLDSLNPYSVLLLTPKLKVDSISATKALLSWSTDSNLSSVKEFRLYQDSTMVTAQKETTYSANDLIPESTYSFYVVAVDGQDKETKPSNRVEASTPPLKIVNDTMPPPPPTGLRSSNIGSNSIDLTWDILADSLQIAAFGVYQDSILLGIVKDNLYQVRDLQAQRTYGFSVTAWDTKERESAFSEVLQLTTLQDEVKDTIVEAPLPPKNLAANEIGAESLSLQWQLPSDSLSVKEFRVFQDDAFIGFTTNTSYGVRSLSPETSYEFTVSLVTENGKESPPSAPFAVTTVEKKPSPIEETAPSAPVDVTVSNVTSNAVELSWTVVEHSVAISSFNVYQDGEFKSSVTNSSLKLTDLLPETVYQFSVSAIGENQLESGLSLAVEATTLAEVSSPRDEEPPTSPKNVSADEVTETTIGLSWEASTDNVAVTAYVIYQNGVEIAEVSGTSFQATGLSSSAEYSFKVKAKDAAENISTASETLQVTTLENVVVDNTPPSVPQNLTTIETTQTTISLRWGASTDDTAVTGYHVYQNNQNIASVQSTAFDISSLVPATTYRYKVTAYDAEGNESGQSLGVSAMTLSEELPETDKILVFTKTAGFRHGSIEKGVATFQALGQSNDFEVVQTENSGDFNTTNLSQYKVVVFLNTTGDILNNTQQVAFENYIQSGGSFMGVHAATDTEYDWPWYGQLVGAYFNGHPKIQEANLEVVNRNHSSTAHLMGNWTRTEEWYNFKDIYSGIKPLIMLDESSYEGGTNGTYHPFSWYQEYDGGRVFYTAGGHSNSAYDEPDFRQHLLGGLLYCLER
ncbi:ThuA domain-containing protein [Cytophaga sp. FL35]|uniref:ThuA domain-containing protein n=1 Tax=Cytophaga sp. FL35 TaxID=1904456 RepID=UPI0016535DFB|nr:ThuA domain-containing protein [Cytophaga sp. FL35]MBC6997431.1 ThuA domain-containing protein [Cytophaga sp. FL35]